MSSPNIDNVELPDVNVPLEANSRSKISTFDGLRDDFLREVDKIRTEDDCLRDFKALLEDLNTEKMALVNELRHVNSDINMIEQSIKQAEASRQKFVENAHRLYNDMMPQCDELNGLRDALGKERLQASIVDCRDLEEVFPGERKSNGATDSQFEQPNLATIWPWAAMAYQQPPFASLRHPNMLNLAALFSAVANQPTPVAQPEDTGSGSDCRASADRAASVNAPDPVACLSNSATFGQFDATTAGLASLSKQQQPPMKTCASCQQQIHRNAPICPLCKSKSRSRHPKNKKRSSKPDEQQQE